MFVSIKLLDLVLDFENARLSYVLFLAVVYSVLSISFVKKNTLRTIEANKAANSDALRVRPVFCSAALMKLWR